jgi:hypothetical protein
MRVEEYLTEIVNGSDLDFKFKSMEDVVWSKPNCSGFVLPIHPVRPGSVAFTQGQGVGHPSIELFERDEVRARLFLVF